MQDQLEYQEGRTEISHMGKVPLIERLTADMEPRNASTVQGIGDDCAVMRAADGRLTLVNTQTLVEGVNFDMMYTPLKHLGYKAVAVALSNIAAMNGTPRQVLVSVAVSNRYSVEAMDELYAGVRLCCERYDVDLVGGETGTSRAGMMLTVTAVGANVHADGWWAKRNRTSSRSTALLNVTVTTISLPEKPIQACDRSSTLPVSPSERARS